MSTATLERPTASLTAAFGGARTLDDVVATAWERLSAGAAVSCPVCEADMRPAPHATGAGACAGCGSTLK